MRPQRTPMKPPRKPGHRHPNAPTDPVEVCARIRNQTNRDEESCIEIVNDTTIRIVGIDNKVTECQFYKVFDQNVGQKHLFHYIAENMVDDLIKGKSGLLFTYGVTSSGKTYTMTGTLEEPGFLARCLDMLFNSIDQVQASKYVFVPDCMNQFSVQSEADALLEKQEKDILPPLSTPKTPSKSRSKVPDVRYDIDHCRSENTNPDCRYAVFVSYVEIYNDYVYDLLEEVQFDAFNRPKPPQSKRLREDRNKNMFVYGVQQIEVKSTEEAFAAFQRGQEKRRIAHTQLNAESSRSHSIFSIRLVQAPLDPLGEDLLQEQSLVCASQLALVDLAGSERMARTGAGGERLREAGNINSSLMTLRRCLEQLRENQKNGTCEMVKYRNSKLTHLFKSYFEGHGRVKMVVCLNPNAQEYTENLHVVQFAEVAQQVEVAQQEEFTIDREQLRRKALEAKTRAEEQKKAQLTAMRQLNSEAQAHRLFRRNNGRQLSSQTSDSDTGTTPSTDDGESDWGEVFDTNLATHFPSMEVADAMDDTTVPNLIAFLQQRTNTVSSLKKKAHSYATIVRSNLTSSSRFDQELQGKLKDCEDELASRNKDLAKMERQVKKLESKNQVLSRTTQVFEKDKKQLQDQLSEREVQLKTSQMEMRKVESKLRGTVANTRAEVEKQCEKRVRNVQAQMQEKMWVKNEQLRQLKHIIADGREGRPPTRKTVTPLPPTLPPTPTSSESSQHARLAHKRRSRSAENLLSDSKSLNKSRHNSENDLRKPKKKASGTSVALEKSVQAELILPPQAAPEPCNRPMTRLRRRQCKKADESDFESFLLEQENEKSLGCKYVNRRDEAVHRHRPAPPVAPKHRRSRSANNNWLAHLPSTTVPTETIMQPCIKPNRVVSVPSPKDVACADKYLLTHQREDREGEIETQLVKGEVFHTRTGGQQVQFVDIETLKQRDPKNKMTKSPNRKRQSNTPMDELSSEEQSSWTDVETREALSVTPPPTSPDVNESLFTDLIPVFLRHREQPIRDETQEKEVT